MKRINCGTGQTYAKTRYNGEFPVITVNFDDDGKNVHIEFQWSRNPQISPFSEDYRNYEFNGTVRASRQDQYYTNVTDEQLAKRNEKFKDAFLTHADELSKAIEDAFENHEISAAQRESFYAMAEQIASGSFDPVPESTLSPHRPVVPRENVNVTIGYQGVNQVPHSELEISYGERDSVTIVQRTRSQQHERYERSAQLEGDGIAMRSSGLSNGYSRVELKGKEEFFLIYASYADKIIGDAQAMHSAGMITDSQLEQVLTIDGHAADFLEAHDLPIFEAGKFRETRDSTSRAPNAPDDSDALLGR
ncbi:MAG TPA: hypothetical protein PKB15_07100 [Acidimicrobiia bacterium]|mgnify:CR=1 FL=1|nr:hypothetical protein [Acidimicrobiia bacterium]